MNQRKRLPGTPEPMHRWEGSDGLMIAADSWGDPKGPLILLQHGGGQTRHAWKGAGETLGAAGYHAVAFDARGHGDSDWSPTLDYDQEPMIADLVALVKHLGNKRPVLVGASMGGGVSLGAIGEDHVDATALVLVDVAPELEPTGAARIVEFMKQRAEGFDTLEQAAEAISNYQPHRKRPRKVDGLVKNLRQSDDGKYHWHWDPGLLDLPRDMKLRTERLQACARKVSLPTLLVRGGLSDVLSEKGAQAFQALCPHSEFVCVEDAGHMVAGDRNDAFSDAVIEFLSRTVPVDGEPIQPPHETRPHSEGPKGDLIDIP